MYTAESRTGLVNDRAGELRALLETVIPEVLEFVKTADTQRSRHQRPVADHGSEHQHSLVDALSSSAQQLQHKLQTFLADSEHGQNLEDFGQQLKLLLHYSVNTSHPGFLDKLYAAPLPPGIVAELLLGILNTNLHVYQVSPVLTLIEKSVAKRLASMFGQTHPRSGGISVQGGSASNMTSIVIARNTLYPETKAAGNSAVKGKLLLFTSAHGHYSIEKAAQALGFGSANVIPVPVDVDGRMLPDELNRLVIQAKAQGDAPFFVNATAGTTVLGSFDPFAEIATIAAMHKLWLHIDGAWGGSFVFSGKEENKEKLRGTELADSIAINPHKMLGTPVTCSFLLGKDLKQFQQANTLRAGYLFHDEDADDKTIEARNLSNDSTTNEDLEANNSEHVRRDDEWEEPNDLADLTLQCGRRGDALKLFLCWQYYGTEGYRGFVDNAYDAACYLSDAVHRSDHLTPVLACGRRPSCLQVCFYFTPHGKFCHSLQSTQIDKSEVLDALAVARVGKLNTKITADIAKALIPRGFMIDFAPALEGQEHRGSFFRVVVNISTVRETTQRLVQDLISVGLDLIERSKYQTNGR